MKLKRKMPFGPCRDEGPRLTAPSATVGVLSPPVQEAHRQDFCFPSRAQPRPLLTSSPAQLLTRTSARRLGVRRCPCWMPSRRRATHPAPCDSSLVPTVCLCPPTSTPSLRSSAHKSAILLKTESLTRYTRTRPYSVLSAASERSRAHLHLPPPLSLLWTKSWGQSHGAARKRSRGAALHFHEIAKSAGAHRVLSAGGAKDARA